MRENVFSLTETTVDRLKNSLNSGVTCQMFELKCRSLFDLRMTIKRWLNAMLGKTEPLILYYTGLWLWKRKELEIIEHIMFTFRHPLGKIKKALELLGLKH